MGKTLPQSITGGRFWQLWLSDAAAALCRMVIILIHITAENEAARCLVLLQSVDMVNALDSRMESG